MIIPSTSNLSYDLEDLIVSSALVISIFTGDENFQATTEFVRKLLIFDFEGLRTALLRSFADGKVRQFDQFISGFEGSTAVRLVRFESLGQQLQPVSIYLFRHNLITLVGFESNSKQFNGIDEHVAKGGLGCEFVECFGVCLPPPLAAPAVFSHLFFGDGFPTARRFSSSVGFR